MKDMDITTGTAVAKTAVDLVKKIKNQKAVAEIAMENAKPGTDFSENSGVSEEWLDRFMDSAGFVGTEEIQWIWGKILANEFERPGSTPPNMIRILSEITPGLASAFRYICSMCIWILPLNEKGDIQGAFRNFLYHIIRMMRNLESVV
jgi:hypothetical protein